MSDISAYEQATNLYTLNLLNFFNAMAPTTALTIHSKVMEVTNDLLVNSNWFLPSCAIQKTTTFHAIREDQSLYTSLIKLERTFAVKLQLEGLLEQFDKSIMQMFITDAPNSSILDKEMVDLIKSNTTINSLDVLRGTPGLIGLLSVMQFHHCWLSEPLQAILARAK